ncbi:MAG: cupin domain-containing protein [Actinomycetota bacterium]
MIIRDLGTTAEEPVSHNPLVTKRVLLRKGEVANLTQVAEATFPPGELAASHTHPDMHELFLCRSGEGRIVVEGTTHALAPGTFVACRPGESHEIRNTGTEPLVVLVVGLLDVGS